MPLYVYDKFVENEHLAMFLKGGNWTLKCNREQISREYLQSDQVVNFHYWLMDFIDIRLCGWVSIPIKEFAGVCQIWHSFLQNDQFGKQFPHLKADIKGRSCSRQPYSLQHLFPSDKMKILVSICLCFSMLLWWLSAENVHIQYVLDFRVLRQTLCVLLSFCD